MIEFFYFNYPTTSLFRIDINYSNLVPSTKYLLYLLIINLKQIEIMKKFRVSGTKIEELQVLKETAKQIVYINSSNYEFRESKVSQWAIWFETFEDAKNHLIEKWTLRVINAENQLTSAKENLNKVSNL